MHADRREDLTEVHAGDIAAILGLKQTFTGETLCDMQAPIVLEAIDFPEPVISTAIEPKSNADQDKMGVALRALSEEDPTFRVHTDEETGQTVISGMGELHLDIILDRLRREFKVECNQGAPQVAYKESIKGSVTHREVYKKQTGGRGKFADIAFTIEPQTDKEKSGLEFVNVIKGGNIPREFIPSVEKGFKEAMKNGVLAGYPLDSMKITLTDGSYHAVDSDAFSFESCARIAYREAMPKANPIILEPIMKLEVVTPEANMGDVVGDLNRRRGQMQGMDDRAGAKVVKALVPLSEMFGYVTQLRTITSGRASSAMEFDHYAEAPKNIADEVVAKAKGKVTA
jgi:elongation factor G